MIKTNKLFTILALTLTSAFSHANCDDISKKSPISSDYFDFRVAQKFNDLELMRKLDSSFCYNYLFNQEKLENPLFNAFSKEQLEFLLPKIIHFKSYVHPKNKGSKDFKRDILTHHLNLPFILDQPVEESTKQEIINMYKKYRSDATLNTFNTKHHIFWLDSKKIQQDPRFLLYLINNVNKNLLPLYSKIDLNKDSLGNTALHYGVLFSNSVVLEHFQPQASDVLKKNEIGANLWHMAFMKPNAILPPVYIQEQQRKINTYLLNTFKPAHLKFMSLGNPLVKSSSDYPFELFMHVFQDNNPELYKSLREKHPSVFKATAEELNAYPLNKEEIIKSFNYL